MCQLFCSAVSRRYIDVCCCDMFSVVNVYLDQLKFCVVFINGRRYACSGECYVVSHHHIVSLNYLIPSLCACLSCIVEL